MKKQTTGSNRFAKSSAKGPAEHSAKCSADKQEQPQQPVAKRILALAGVVLLLGLYASTLFAAIFAGENFMKLLMTSIYATIVVPVLLWAYSFIYHLIRGHFHAHDPDDSSEYH